MEHPHLDHAERKTLSITLKITPTGLTNDHLLCVSRDWHSLHSWLLYGALAQVVPYI